MGLPGYVAGMIRCGVVQEAEATVQQLREQLLACEKRAQHATAAEAAALLRAQASEERAAAARCSLQDTAAAGRKCMHDMHAVEGTFSNVTGKLDEFSKRMDFAGMLRRPLNP